MPAKLFLTFYETFITPRSPIIQPISELTFKITLIESAHWNKTLLCCLLLMTKEKINQQRD